MKAARQLCGELREPTSNEPCRGDVKVDGHVLRTTQLKPKKSFDTIVPDGAFDESSMDLSAKSVGQSFLE